MTQHNISKTDFFIVLLEIDSPGRDGTIHSVEGCPLEGRR